MRVDAKTISGWQTRFQNLVEEGPVNDERGAVEVDVSGLGDEFLSALHDAPEVAKSLRSVSPHFWLEMGSSWRLVAPVSNAPIDAFTKWGECSAGMWQAIEGVNVLIAQSTDFSDDARRAALKERLVEVNAHVREVESLLSELHKVARTPVSALVDMFVGRLNNIAMPYEFLRQFFDTSEWFGETIDDISAKRFGHLDVFGRTSGSTEKSISRIPAFSIDVGTVPPEGVVPASDCLGAAHALFDRVALMGAMLASPVEKRSVELRFSCAGHERRGDTKWANIVVDNPDGLFALHLNQLMKHPHLFPASWCEIPQFAAQVAPEGFGLKLLGTQMHVPLRIR